MAGSAQPTDAKNIHQGIEFNAYGQLTDAVRILGGATWIETFAKMLMEKAHVKVLPGRYLSRDTEQIGRAHV